MNLAWWLEKATWEHHEKIAVIDGINGRQITYAELTSLSSRIGNVLREDTGVEEDDVVATILPNDYWHMALLYGLLKIGAVFNGLNPKSVLGKFKQDVTTSEAKTVVVSRQHLDTARTLQRDTCIENVLVCDEIETDFPNLRKMASEASDRLRIAPRTSDEMAVVNFTAGTSGASKGVVFTHGKLGLSAMGSVFSDGLKSADTNLAFTSLFHSGGIHNALTWVLAGGTLIWSGGWDADRAIRLIDTYRPTWIHYWIPSMVRDLMRHPGWDGLDLRGIKTYLTGEAVPAELQQLLVEEKGMRAAIVYGLTETMAYAILKPSFYYEDDKVVPYGSSGRPSKDLCEVKVQDPLSGSVVEGVGTGEVCVRGEVVTPGYYNDPERTAEVLDGEGFLRTNDLVHRDEKEWYWIGGRTDDLISTGGEKLSIYEVDDLLLNHPGVRDAACIGVAHERLGQVPAAFVAPAEPTDEEEIKSTLDAYCAEKMERWKRPRLYAIVEEVPRTAAKRNKSVADLNKLLEGIILKDSEGVTTLSRMRADNENPVS